MATILAATHSGVCVCVWLTGVSRNFTNYMIFSFVLQLKVKKLKRFCNEVHVRVHCRMFVRRSVSAYVLPGSVCVFVRRKKYIFRAYVCDIKRNECHSYVYKQFYCTPRAPFDSSVRMSGTILFDSFGYSYAMPYKIQHRIGMKIEKRISIYFRKIGKSFQFIKRK